MKTAFLFPGQGAQKKGMGKDLYETNNIYRKTFDECSEGAELDLTKACFEGERMDESEVVQPAIFAHSMSLLSVLKEYGVDADVCAGLSLGEYSALAAAGAIDVAQGAALVRKRGNIMDAAFDKGVCSMLSVIGFDIDKVMSMLGGYDSVHVANHISELQIVLSGYVNDLKKLEQVFLDEGAKMAALLDVAGPFHSELLEGAANTFSEVLEKEPMKKPLKQVYSNVLGKLYGRNHDKKKLLRDQLCTRVKWHDCTEHMINSGIDTFIEVGPSNVLSKLIKRRTAGGVTIYNISSAKTLEKFLKKTAN